MPINDNGDIFRAVGYVAVYGAYLEDRIAELIDLAEKYIDLRKNIHNLSATDQAKHLLTALIKTFEKAPSYFSKETDLKQISDTLESVKLFTEERNHIIHSVLTSSAAGIITQTNRRDGTEASIESKEVINFANEVFEFQSQIYGLTFPIKQLIRNLPN